MTFGKLLLSIGLAIVGFWLLGLVLTIAAWVLDVALIIGLILVIISLINMYIEGKKRK
ncbi:MAG: hypothetical protein WC761_05570 [Candidatus Paceibacterota bacterium]|jgi:hypothetical protein